MRRERNPHSPPSHLLMWKFMYVVQRGELTLLKPHSKLVATEFKSEVSFPSYTVNLCP